MGYFCKEAYFDIPNLNIHYKPKLMLVAELNFVFMNSWLDSIKTSKFLSLSSYIYFFKPNSEWDI